MKNKNLYILLLSMLASGATMIGHAQSAVDAFQLTQRDLKGTARFMSMGGAFTALGGDLSAISVNPAGIGVYRSSEIAATLDIDFQKSNALSPGISSKNTQTKALCNNFGYVGTVKLDGALQTLSWGVNYNRQASFDRKVGGSIYPVGTSLTNYIASFTNGIKSSDMDFGSGSNSYNPYQDSNIDWLSILGYSSYLINNTQGRDDRYQGLFNSTTNSDAEMLVVEKGYIDNYELTFGGNVQDVFFWGVGIGINDLRYVRHTYYSESMSDASVYSPQGVTRGAAEYALYNDKIITGTGWNFSIGAILKPVQEFRVGVSFITPTVYSLNESYIGSVDYAMQPDGKQTYQGTEDTDEAYFPWKLRSPWRLNLGLAGVIGRLGIISLDYELQDYNNTKIKTPSYNAYGFVNGYYDAAELNQDIKDYSQMAHNIRLGLEYRVSNRVSARLGCNMQFSNIRNEYQDGKGEILTSGTDPSFSLDKTTTFITAGLGYQYKNFAINGAYVHKIRKSTLHPYTSYGNVQAPYFDVTDNNNSIVLSAHFKF